MTKITIDRALVEQALEALEVYATHRGLPGPCPVRNVEYALRATLAQQDERDWSLLEATQESLREHMAEIHRLRAALAQQAEPVAVAERERIAAQWDGCVTHQLDTFGPVDIGASIRAGELVEPAQQAEPVKPVAWKVSEDGRVIYDDTSEDDGLLRVSGDFETDEQRARYAQRVVDKLNAAPPQRLPLTEEEIEHIGMTHQSLRQVVRAVEKAVWEKNHE